MRKLLLNPGPANVNEVVKQESIREDFFHREETAKEYIESSNNEILKVLGGSLSHSAVLFASSSTGSQEAILSSINGKILTLESGKYGARMEEITKKYGIPTISIKIEHFRELDLELVEEVLNSEKDIEYIAFTHVETSLGIKMPLRAIGKLAKKYNKKTIVDLTASIGGQHIDLIKDNITFCFFSVNKCLESLTGLSYVIGETKEIKKLEGKSKSYYFDLFQQWKSLQRAETPFTISISLVAALKKALEFYSVETINGRIERYKSLSTMISMGLTSLGFELFEMPQSLKVDYLINVIPPNNVEYYNLRDILSKKGIIIYTSKELVDRNIIQFATIGSLNTLDIQRVLSNLKQVL